jgi:hypothetical protein
MTLCYSESLRRAATRERVHAKSGTSVRAGIGETGPWGATIDHALSCASTIVASATDF